MKKMGFEVGMSLGKISSSRDSIKEPINVVLKSNREGLGCAEDKKRKLYEYEMRKKRRYDQKQVAEQLNAKSFLNNKKLQFEMKKTERMLSKAQRICYQLDLTAVMMLSISVKTSKIKLLLYSKGQNDALKVWHWPRDVQKKKIEENLTDDSKCEQSQLGGEDSEEEIESFEVSRLQTT